MSSKPHPKFITLGIVNLELSEFENIFTGCSEKTIELIKNTYIFAKRLKYKPSEFGLDLEEGELFVKLDSLADILEIKPPSLVARINRSGIFNKEVYGKTIIYKLSSKSNILRIRTPDDKAWLEKRNATIAQRSSFESKYRRNPPIKKMPDYSGMIKTPLGDLSSLCVAGDADIIEKRFSMNIRKKGSTVKTLVIASGAHGIVKFKDLKTLYALIAHTIEYHISLEDYYDRRSEIPKNKTPIYADVILEIIGKKPGERKAREELWQQITRFRTTEYDVHSVTSIVSKDEKEYFLNDQFRIIDRTPSVAEEAISTDDDSIPAPAYYEIIWHKMVFESLFKDTKTFALPTKLFKEPDEIFNLYIHLRKKMNAIGGQSGDIFITSDELYDMNLEESNKYDFMRSFMNRLIKTNRSALKGELTKAQKKASKEKPAYFVRDLFGFKVKLEVTGSKTFEGLVATFNIDDILSNCNIKKNKGAGVSAPTIPNRLKRYAKALMLESDNGCSEDEKKKLDLRLLQNNARSQMSSIDLCVERTDCSVSLQVGNSELKMLMYNHTKDDEIGRFLSEIQLGYGKDLTPTYAYLLELRNRLKPALTGHTFDGEFEQIDPNYYT